MTSPVYGTDMVDLQSLLLYINSLSTKVLSAGVLLIFFFLISEQMVGIGTSDVNLDKYRHTFCSLLGKDADSWGLSYTGKIQMRDCN